MAHKQGIVATEGLIGGIVQTSRGGAASAFTTSLHEADRAAVSVHRRMTLRGRVMQVGRLVARARARFGRLSRD